MYLYISNIDIYTSYLHLDIKYRYIHIVYIHIIYIHIIYIHIIYVYIYIIYIHTIYIYISSTDIYTSYVHIHIKYRNIHILCIYCHNAGPLEYQAHINKHTLCAARSQKMRLPMFLGMEIGIVWSIFFLFKKSFLLKKSSLERDQ